MPRAIRRDRKTTRSFVGERDANLVLEWLNPSAELGDWYDSVEAVESRARVLDVIFAIRHLLEEIDKRPTWRPTQPPTKRQPAKIGDAFHELNLKLASYTSFSVFFPEPKKARRWDTDDALIGNHLMGESQAVHAIVRLTQQNILHRLQLCACGLWYFLKFSHQKFCSAKCRTDFWESSEERKEQKRERARSNYIYRKAYKGK
jgi:hypothetical protein